MSTRLRNGIPTAFCNRCGDWVPNHLPGCALAGTRTVDAHAELLQTASGRALLQTQSLKKYAMTFGPMSEEQIRKNDLVHTYVDRHVGGTYAKSSGWKFETGAWLWRKDGWWIKKSGKYHFGNLIRDIKDRHRATLVSAVNAAEYCMRVERAETASRYGFKLMANTSRTFYEDQTGSGFRVYCAKAPDWRWYTSDDLAKFPNFWDCLKPVLARKFPTPRSLADHLGWGEKVRENGAVFYTKTKFAIVSTDGLWDLQVSSASGGHSLCKCNDFGDIIEHAERYMANERNP